jgi:putative membrane protein
MVIAIIGSSFGIDYLFAAFPVQTNMLFVGLILGSLPAVHKKVKGNPVKPGHIISALLFFALVAGMAMLNGSEGGNVSFDKSFVQIVLLFLVGVVASGTMVIPGVSGSMMLLLLGYYNPILATIKDFIVALTSLDGKAIADALFVLVPFGIGVVVGIIVLAKLVEFIFNKFPLYAYWSIIGLLIASPIAILMVGTFPEITIVHILTGIVTFALGWFISLKLGDKE